MALARELERSVCAVKRGIRASAALLFLLAASCGGSASPGVAASSPTTEISPSFSQILSASKTVEYMVTYKLTATGQGAGVSGEQSWYFKQGKARFDFKRAIAGDSSNVSLFALTDGTFMCSGAAAPAQCTSMSGLETALQQNPAAFYQASMTAHPEQFSGIVVGTRHIGEQHAHCYEVHTLADSSELSGSRFCYSSQGIPLSSRVSGSAGQWSMEATSLSTTVPDSDFALPAQPSGLSRP